MKKTPNFYILLLFVAGILSCNNKHVPVTENHPLSSKDSILLTGLLDSLSQNYLLENNRMVNRADSIISKFPTHEAEINIKIAYIHFSKANYFLAEQYFENAAQLFLNDSLWGKYAGQLSNIGVIKEMTGSYTEATEKYFEALAVFDSLGMELKSSRIYNNLGIVYQQLNEYDKALANYRKSLEITERLNRPEISAKRYNNIATIYEESEKGIDSALYYYRRAYKIWKKDSNSRFLAIVENNIGNIHLLKNELIIADSLFKEALSFCLKSGQMGNIGQILRNQAELLIRQKKFSEAISKAEEAMGTAQKDSNKEIELESLKVLIKALEKTNQFEKANKKIKEYYKLQEELSGLKQKEQINQLNIEYQVKEKEHKIQILELKNKVQNRKLLEQGLIIFALLVLLTGLFLVFRLSKKNNELKMIQMRSDISDYISQIEEIKEQKKDIDINDFRNKIAQFDLTEREEEVLIYISKGYKNSEIAEKMFVSVNTIKTHTKNLFIKLDVRNRTEAARKTKLS